MDFKTLSSQDLDRYFGYEIDEVERSLLRKAMHLRPQGNMSNFGEVLHGGHQTWVGLDPQTLNTPYSELIELCHLLKPGPDELIVDLGAGYGRLGLILNLLYPGSRFLGFELVEERVQEGMRVLNKNDCRNACLKIQDLTDPDFLLPVADVYFLYDYGKTSHIRETLGQLEKLTEKHHFRVVARGKGSRSIIEYEHPWLSQLHPVHHEMHFSIYTF